MGLAMQTSLSQYRQIEKMQTRGTGNLPLPSRQSPRICLSDQHESIPGPDLMRKRGLLSVVHHSWGRRACMLLLPGKAGARALEKLKEGILWQTAFCA
ncbi:MAG TPA: hypothetical protein VN776_10130 [Terracidiphilus sp.]|nr:hypothetical protein [Terracidiphilus sp.]